MAEYQLPKQLFLDEAAIRMLPDVVKRHPVIDLSTAAKVAYEYAQALWAERERMRSADTTNNIQEQIGEESVSVGRRGPEF